MKHNHNSWVSVAILFQKSRCVYVILRSHLNSDYSVTTLAYSREEKRNNNRVEGEGQTLAKKREDQQTHVDGLVEFS